MRIRPFELERFFSRHEFTAPYTLTSSDCEPLTLYEVLELADDEERLLWDGLKLGYSEIPGSPRLRRQVAALYEGIGEEQVQVAAPEECIFLAMNAMLDEGDHVVSTGPGYQSLYEIATALGCEVDRWLPDEGAGWRFDVDALAGLVRPDTKAVVVNFPHNPTGYLPPRKDFEDVVGLAREVGAYLFSDEMYRFLELEPSRRLPAACDTYTRAVSLSGMSKAFGLPGVRIGWLATGDAALLERVRVLREYTTICSSTASESLSVIALKAKDVLIDSNMKRLERNLGLLDDFFVEHEGLFGWVRPGAGTVAFPRVRFGGSARGFCEDLLQRAGVLLVPSTVFGYGDSHFRVGFGREDMPGVLERLREYVKDRATA